MPPPLTESLWYLLRCSPSNALGVEDSNYRTTITLVLSIVSNTSSSVGAEDSDYRTTTTLVLSIASNTSSSLSAQQYRQGDVGLTRKDPLPFVTRDTDLYCPPDHALTVAVFDIFDRQLIPLKSPRGLFRADCSQSRSGGTSHLIYEQFCPQNGPAVQKRAKTHSF